MRGSLLVLAMVVLETLPTPARAQTHLYPLYNAAQSVHIGMVTHNGGGNRAWVCWDGPSAGDGVWVRIGTTSGLDGHYIIHGDRTGETQYADLFATGAYTTSASDCQPDSGPGWWGTILYNGNYLDIEADGGNDTVWAGFTGDTVLFGESGDDTLELYSCDGSAAADGGSGNDTLLGLAGDCDDLSGGSGDDCLDDLNDVSGTYYCGTDTTEDEYEEDDTPSGADCEDDVTSYSACTN